MIIRVQGKSGTKRFDVQSTDTLRSLLGKIVEEFGLSTTDFSIYRKPGQNRELNKSHLDLKLDKIPLQHGDLLYLAEKATNLSNAAQAIADEDEVDKILAEKDARIERPRDPQLCHHGAQGRCINCAPLEPWDQRYLDTQDPPVKHLSFHCHCRKLTSGVDKGKFAYLEDLSCKIKSDCPDHAPWPAGICTKCQPSAITLARQSYRHVDNIMFEDKKIVERFLEVWRKSGHQRIGHLYGKYEEYPDVPLGIRAVVSAIYEPPQVATKYSVELLEDPREQDVRELAGHLGLRKVGWIFTDLELDTQNQVAYKRSIHTHLLSAEECIMAADFQNCNPNPCKLTKKGYFGSKFVTVCVSGNESKQVDLQGYQVSNQCMALVRDDCLVPTLDAPELGYVRESTPEQLVPDVFYKTKNEYGIEVTKIARPLPLEYLIIELTTSSPVQPKPYLVGGLDPAFPIENRESLGDIQDFTSFAKYLQHQTNFLCAMSDLHLLLFMYTSSVIHLRPYIPLLCKAIQSGNKVLAEQWRQNDWWATVEELIKLHTVGAASTHSAGPVFPRSVSQEGEMWACKICTLLNPAHLAECDACHLPRT